MAVARMNVGHAFSGQRRRIAAICSSDANYADLADTRGAALKHARVPPVYLMGRPDEAQRAGLAGRRRRRIRPCGRRCAGDLERAYAREAGEAA